MVKKLKKPKFKKLKKFKVMKARGGDAARSAAASGNMGGRADPSGGVDRSAVGEGSQYQANVQAQQQKSEARAKTMQNLSNVGTVVSMFTNPIAAVAKYGYSQFKKGKQNKMDYEGQAAGVTPMASPKTTYATNTGGGDNRPTKTVANTVAPKPLFQNVTPSNVAASNFMVRPGVRLAPLNVANMPKASPQGFMIRPGVALSDVAKASNGKLIKGHPKLAKKGWK
jgi:hypothetical protein